MCQSIRGQSGHLGFRIDIKVTTLGRDTIRNICTKFGVDPASVVEKKSFKGKS